MKGSTLDTAKLFSNGSSQAVRLPKKYRFSGEEVYIRKHGEIVYLFPKEKAWEIFSSGLENFSDDYMADGRQQPAFQDLSSL
ncbi:MAG: type II toxin-antitoxin system VapB family antitoxin [Coriobacteriales bacterium]|jgi:antitoxin VapB|nr:type II toxin-antitoxin system VapB family antitoxin [Coriobacteriales bacterium]